MKLKAKIEDQESDIEIKTTDEKTTIAIDGVERDVAYSEIKKGTYLFKTESGVFEAYVAPKSATEFEVSVGTDSFNISLYDPKSLQGAIVSAGTHDGVAEIKSAMPGKVVKILVKAGDEVAIGDGVVVVEAMKMQNELKSPKDGIVGLVSVAEEDRVNAGDLLLTIE